MSRAVLWVTPVAAAVGALLGVWWPWPAAVVAATLAGVLFGALAWARQRRRVRTVARRVNAWLGEGEREPLHLEGGLQWRELAVAVNALGSAHHRALDELADAAPGHHDIVTSVDGPALLFTGDEHLIAANAAARRLLGVPPVPARVTLIQALGSAALAGAAREAADTGRAVQVDAELGGRELRATASPLGAEILVLINDRTEQRRVEELRRNFVLNASHELKTPATAIQTLAEALEVAVDADPVRATRLVQRLREESERLARMVHDLLDLRRLEERGPLELAPVDLVRLVREAVADVHHLAAERDVEIAVDAPDQARIAGVEQDLRLALTNLLQNAVQYNVDGGRVDVTIAPDNGSYVLTIADTGVGIPQQDLRRVFERFYRVDVGRSRERGGTGLGLSIVRHALERHGGTVRGESLLGDGSTFTLRLPIEPPDR